MMNSRSRASTSSPAAVAVLVVASLFALAGDADAAPRKRVVVLDFTGPAGEKFHDDLVRLVKKSYTLVPTDKWSGTADELNATKPTDANVAKIAKKLKVDAIIIGKIEKRRDEYLVHLKLRSGKSGTITNSSDTKTPGPRLDGKASSDVKDELLDAIAALQDGDAGGGGDDDDDADAKPVAAAKKKPAGKKGDDDDDDDKPAAKKKPAVVAKKGGDDDDDDLPADAGKGKSGFGKKKPVVVAKKGGDDDDDDDKPAAGKKKPADTSHDDDDSPLKGGKKKPPPPPAKTAASDDDDDDGGKKPPPKKVAAKGDDDDDDDGGSVHKSTGERGSSLLDSENLSPGQRAVDADLGISITARRLKFRYKSTLANPPPGYNGVPVAGAYLDATFFPGDFSHTRRGIAKDLGIAVTYDKVLHVTSQVLYTDANGASQVATLPTSAEHWSIGVAYRHAFNDSASSPVIGAQLRYSHQAFGISQNVPNNMTPDIPSVTYKGVEPSVSFHYPVNPKLELNVDAGLQIVSSAGMISEASEYGTGSVLGFDGTIGADYRIKRNLFIRVALDIETVGLTFKGTGTMSTSRDGDPTTQDVLGARDNYFGGAVTLGYLY